MIEARYLLIDSALGFVEIVHPANGSTATDDATPTVLCIHTAGQNGVQWRHVASALADKGYRVVVPDLPGHGRSEPAANGPVTDLTAYGDWLWKLLDALGIGRPYVIGCSIGGKLTLDLATRPERPLAGAIAMAAEAGPGRVNVAGLRRELEDVAGPSRGERTYLGTLASVGDTVPADRADLIATMHRREDPVISSSDLIGWGGHDVRERLCLTTCPVHMIAGEQDPWITPDTVRADASRIRGARFTMLAGIGHYPMEEVEDFADVAATWLGELADVPRSTRAEAAS
ncbi:alpha/beta fold hydrolase [Rhodococcus sp. TAF43]|uniref:alpha/beta fold hydrolase n=1 Tax=unclassified Rhodococcus (in: high G+C Gram-positive bacteria) TaxID=192944 RepID=UPI001581BD44|nr:alpha/beta hydrolase [Rhodococcus sp. W8901]QKT09992.1 alpha/beta hydrolase [Rhodococcus sp. W8901]